MSTNYKKLTIAMSRQFFNLQSKTSQYYQMKALNERISEWAHLSL